MNQTLKVPLQGDPHPEAKAVVWMATIVCVGLAALWGTQIFDAGFYHDDSVTSDFAAEAQLGGQTAWSYSVRQFAALVNSQGRCSLAYALGVTPFLVLIGDDLPLYRAWHWAWTIMALASFSWCVKRISRDWMAALFSAAVCLSLFSTNSFHSSLVSYGVIIQQVVVFGFLGAVLAYMALEQPAHRRRAMGGSLISIAIAVMTSEFGLIFLALVVFVFCLQLGWRKGLWWGSPFVLGALVYVGATFLAKQPGQYEGAAFGRMEPALILTTWLKQISGTFPCSFPLTPEGQTIFGADWLLRMIFSPTFWLFWGFSAFAFLWFVKRLGTRGVLACRPLASIGLLLVVLSASLTSISAKYQKSLSYGVPYVQVFIQYMGLAIIMVAAWLWFQNAVRSKAGGRVLTLAQPMFAVLLACLYASTLELNHQTVAYQNRVWHFPRNNLADALSMLKIGGAEPIVFVIDRTWLQRWEWTPFAYRHTQRAAEFMTLPEFLSEKRAGPSPGRQARFYFVSYPIRSGPYASVFIAEITTVVLEEGRSRLLFVPDGARLIQFGPDLESVTTANRVADLASGFPEGLHQQLATREIQPGRFAAISRVPGRTLPLK
ncbi:MAG: hypothetical protein ABIR71_06915 [Chthoniobacterales bacterium]